MMRAAGRLAHKHRLLFVVIKDEELESEERRRPGTATDVTRANVAAALLAGRQLVIARLQRLGVDVIEVPADAMGARVVDAYLGIKRQGGLRSEEHTSELQSLMRISYAVFCLKKKKSAKSDDESQE